MQVAPPTLTKCCQPPGHQGSAVLAFIITDATHLRCIISMGNSCCKQQDVVRYYNVGSPSYKMVYKPH